MKDKRTLYLNWTANYAEYLCKRIEEIEQDRIFPCDYEAEISFDVYLPLFDEHRNRIPHIDSGGIYDVLIPINENGLFNRRIPV